MELHELVAILIAQGGVDSVVELGRVECDADGDESVHLVVLLGDAVVLGVLLEVLGPRDVYKNMGEHADGVGVAAHHHVAEPNVVIRGEVGGHDAGEHGFLVQLDIVEGFESKAEVPQQAVDS